MGSGISGMGWDRELEGWDGIENERDWMGFGIRGMGSGISGMGLDWKSVGWDGMG